MKNQTAVSRHFIRPPRIIAASASATIAILIAGSIPIKDIPVFASAILAATGLIFCVALYRTLVSWLSLRRFISWAGRFHDIHPDNCINFLIITDAETLDSWVSRDLDKK
jgi:hypothetical protein